MGLLLSLLLGFAPSFLFASIIYWLDRYEKEPKFLLAIVFGWGAIFAAGAAYLLNTALNQSVYTFTGSPDLTHLTLSALVAPVVEESLKGLAVLAVFLIYRYQFDSLLDGVVYAAIVALGFAATENAFYIYARGYLPDGLTGLFQVAYIRIFLVPWQHPFYTAFIGIGLAAARLSRKRSTQILAPLAGWALAVFTHAFHNTLPTIIKGPIGLLLNSMLDWSGWFFMFVFILWAIYRERRWIEYYLRQEVEYEILSPAHYQTACSAWKQGAARLGALFNGRWETTNRFYRQCARLAYKKHQYALFGEERERPGNKKGNTHIIQSLRAELKKLTPYAETY